MISHSPIFKKLLNDFFLFSLLEMLLNLNVISYRLEMYRSKSHKLFPIHKSMSSQIKGPYYRRNRAFYHVISDNTFYVNKYI